MATCNVCGNEHPGVTRLTGNPMTDNGSAVEDWCSPWPEDTNPEQAGYGVI